MFYDKFGNAVHVSLENDVKSINNLKKLRSFSVKKTPIPKTIYAKKFLIRNLAVNKKRSRCISILGHLHHGKSTFINVLSSSVHLVNQKSLFKDFSDFFFLEKQRALSLHSSITTLLLCNRKGKSFIITLIDCPGHPEFFDQSLIGIKISDGSLIIIDISEGFLMGTELALRNCIIEGSSIVIIFNAIDRLILEYGYSPKMIQKMIIKILDEINSILEECVFKNNFSFNQKLKFFNPIDNNVCFASFLQGWSFTLEQYAEIYISSQPSICLSSRNLCLKFWNNFYYETNENSYQFLEICKKKSMFVHFVLEPLYKLIFLTLSEPILHIHRFLEVELGIYGIKNNELTVNSENLIISCFTFFFGGCRQTKLTPNHCGLISSVIKNIPCFIKTEKYKKNFFKKFKFLSCLGYIYKLCPIQNENVFFGLTRIMNGIIKRKAKVFIITEGHHYYSKEYIRMICEIEEIFLPIGRYNINISTAYNGSIVFIKGVDDIVRKSAIFFRKKIELKNLEKFYFSILKKISEHGLYNSLSISVEPLYLDQLKKLYKSLRKCSKIYSLLSCEVNQSGSLIIHGPGELYLDCVLHDSRFVFENIDLKISNPFSTKKETIRCPVGFSETFFDDKLRISLEKNYNSYDEINSDHKNKIFPTLKKNFSSNYWKKVKQSINAGFIVKNIGEIYQINKSKVNSFWFLGPESISTPSCCLVADLINKKIPISFKRKMNQGFKLAVEKGPFMFEHLHQIKFEINIKKKNLYLKSQKKHFLGDIRRIFHTICLKNEPIFYEPLYLSEISFHSKFFSAIVKIIQSRKGVILSSNFFAKDKIFIIRFNISSSYSIGLDSEFNLLSNRNINCRFFFENWKKSSQKIYSKYSK
nr:U5 small nuclear ribonucleoprotein 116 kDa subunit [Cryptomonas curvata]